MKRRTRSFLIPWKIFVILFSSIHVLNLILVFLVMGFWDAGLSLGFPKAFYIINCGFNIQNFTCPIGFNSAGLGIDLLFWYITAVIINFFKTKN